MTSFQNCRTARSDSSIHRLNGDYNPLHADPAVARKAGFERPILHGLCTWNMTARVVLSAFTTEGDALSEFQARFTSVVYPGAILVVEMWNLGYVNPANTQSAERIMEVRFCTTIKESGKKALSNGRALIKVKQETSRL